MNFIQQSVFLKLWSIDHLHQHHFIILKSHFLNYDDVKDDVNNDHCTACQAGKAKMKGEA